MRNIRIEWGIERCFNYTLERVTTYASSVGSETIAIADKPSGGKKEDDKLLTEFIERIQADHNYVPPESMAMNIITMPSRLSRHLQIADLVTGITTAMVAGKDKYAAPLFEEVKPIFLRNDFGFIGGTGLKVYPDALINLYHWILGETHFAKIAKGAAMPIPSDKFLYAEHDGT